MTIAFQEKRSGARFGEKKVVKGDEERNGRKGSKGRGCDQRKEMHLPLLR
jgi:hypothetical protein